MPKDHADKSQDITPIGLGGSIRPRSFLDVVSIVENYFIAEKGGNRLPDNLLTFKGKIMVSEVGFKGAAVSGIISIFLAPFFIAVIERYIPIFGSYEFTIFDQAFALALAVSFSLGYGLILASIGKYYIGNLPTKTINWLMMGLTIAGILKITIAFLLYNSLYVLVLDTDRVASFLARFHPRVSYEILNKIFLVLMEIKPILLTSANFIIISTLLMVTVPWGFIFVASRKTRRAILREEIWK